MFELVPPLPRVRFLEVALLHDDRQHRGNGLGAFLVALLAWKRHRLRVIIHAVRVFARKRVEQPRRGRKRPAFRRLIGEDCSARCGVAGAPGAPDGLPMAELPPQFILDDPLFEVGLAVLVLLECLRGLRDLIAPDHSRRRSLDAHTVLERAHQRSGAARFEKRRLRKLPGAAQLLQLVEPIRVGKSETRHDFILLSM